MKANTKLNIEYSALLGLFWAADGVAFNFAAVYLQFRGYTNHALGLVLALSNILGFFVQPPLAEYIDKRNKKPLLACIFVISLVGTFAAAVSRLTDGSGLVQSAAYVTMLVVVILLQPITNSASTYLCTWGYDIQFPRSRGVGSLCFAFGMFAAGILCKRVSPAAVSVMYGILVLLMAALTALLMYQDKNLRAVPPHIFDNKAKAANSIGVFIRENRRFCVYLVGIVLLFLSHAISSNFFIEFLRPLGGDSEDMGNIFCLMALCEIPAMLLFDRITKRIRCSTLLVFSAFMFALKAFAFWRASSLAMMYAAVCLQAVSFAVFIPASVRYVESVIKKRDSVKGQAFTTAMITFGCVIASYLGGVMLDSVGPECTLLTGFLAALAGAGIMLPGVQKTDPAE